MLQRDYFIRLIEEFNAAISPSGATRSLLSCAIWRFRTPARRVTPSLVRFA